MKYFLMTVLVGIQTYAYANVGDATSGLECSMIYRSSNMFSSHSLTSSNWLVAGDELAGAATVNDGDGQSVAATPAHYIEISEKKIDLSDFWTIKVLNSEKSVVGVFELPKVKVFAGETASMKTSFQVIAYEETGGDPIEYDTLDVICSNVPFAG